MAGDIGTDKKGEFIDKKNVNAASYIAAFANRAKGMQWTQAAKRKFIGAGNLDNHFDKFEYRYNDLFSREYGFPKRLRQLLSRMMMVGLTMRSHSLRCKPCDCMGGGSVAIGKLTETL